MSDDNVIDPSVEIVPPPIGTLESDEFRRKRLNASELADCLGVGKYASRFDKWEDKTGRRTRQPASREQLRAMEIGTRLERYLLEDWAEEQLAEILDYQIPGIVCRDPEIRATVESICELPTGERVVVEVKTTSSLNHELGEEHSDEIALSWRIQVECEMVAANLERCIVVVLDRTTCSVSQYSVPRNRDMMDLIIERAREFWGYVRDDLTPPVSWCDVDQSLARHLYLPDLGAALDWTGTEAAGDWAAYERLGKQIREMEAERDKIKAEVIVKLGDHKRALLGDGRELVVQEIRKNPYTVYPKPYCQLKARKVK